MIKSPGGLWLPSGTQMRVDPAALRRDLFAHRLPWSEKYRSVYGRQLDLDRIEQALLSARVGIMVDIADLGREQLVYDPHLGKLPQRRFGAQAIADWTLTPRTKGLSRAEKRDAVALADMVRDKIERIRNFRQGIYDLAWGYFDGRAALEIDWQWSGGRTPYTPVAIDVIHPRRIGLGPQRELRLVETFVRVGWFEPVGLDFREVPGKFITHAPRRFGDYQEIEGLNPRSIYYSFFKRFAARQRMILTELFTLPWRTLEADKDAPVQREDMEAAAEDAELLGDQSTAAFSPGVHLKVWWPGSDNQGQIFQLTSEDVDSQMSRLWMLTDDTGKSGADAAGGTGGDQASLLAQQHNLCRQMDGVGISEVIQQYLVEVIVLLNAGPDALPYAPLFELRTQPPKDRKAEQERLDKAVQGGVPVALADYYEATGIRPPEDDEAVLVIVPGEGGVGTIKILVPEGVTPPPGLVPPAAPTSVGGAEKGTNDPLRIAEGDGGAQNDREHGGDPTPEDAHDDPLAEIEMPNQRAPGQGEEERAGDGLQPGEELTDAVRKVLGLTRQAFRLARQPDLGHGSPEVIIDRGVREGARYTSVWAASVCAAVDGLATPTTIHRALEQAERSLALDPLAASLERCMVRGVMLGALDAAWEAESDQPVALPTFERSLLLIGRPTPGFAASPFQAAIRFFLSKAVLPRREFDRLRADLKAKAFTVAGLARTEMLQTAKDSLAKALELGSDLRAFSKDLGARFDSAGWTRLKASHVELVLRNNVMGSYADGRDKHMRQPEVLAARPYWQILGVDDSRTRATHKAAHGKVLRADDPFWSRSPLPWGHNERCRKVSRSERDLKRLGLSVTSGAMIHGLPDQGWSGTGGSSASLPAPDAQPPAAKRIFGETGTGRAPLPGFANVAHGIDDPRRYGAQVNNVRAGLAQIPEAVQAFAIKQGAVVHVEAVLSDRVPELKGVRPRGWPSGQTWDNLRGCYSPTKGAIVAVGGTRGGTTAKGSISKEENVAVHEWGHAIDEHGPVRDGKRQRFSDQSWWTDHWRRITTKAPGADVDALEAWTRDREGAGNGDYFRQDPPAGAHELWAETISAAYQRSPGSRQLLEKHFPGLLDLMAERMAEAWGL